MEETSITLSAGGRPPSQKKKKVEHALTARFLNPRPLVVSRRAVVGGQVDSHTPSTQDRSAVADVARVDHGLLGGGGGGGAEEEGKKRGG